MGCVSKKKKSKNSLLQNNHIYVLDASAIYNGVLTHNISGDKYIPECVLEEVRGMIRGEAIIEEALLYEELQIIVPNEEILLEIKKQASETGDIRELSACDLAVLAVGRSLQKKESKVIILSDDYDIQNLAQYVGLNCKGIHWKGITSIHKYYWICPGCGNKSKSQTENCIECGTKVIRKTHKKKIRK
ncbi:MAG: hypothetical protein FK732_07125 [Asgard group archaeon]|nr:hypothetical protein [Asgard group archaeon]